MLARNVNVVCLAFAAGVLRPAAAMIAEAMLFVLLFASLALYTPLAALLSVVIFLPAVWLYYALVRNRTTVTANRRTAPSARSRASWPRPSGDTPTSS